MQDLKFTFVDQDNKRSFFWLDFNDKAAEIKKYLDQFPDHRIVAVELDGD